ncbi:PWI domain-containing protein [Periconia macrospinosa]|uniref:PWI domain-containing protein n=1 Tax=Periconia macrospinosa TaxID=97972 RepID=A0A2V1ECM2_9PLEO|nr:PWI domain-containing protein [Periconia macrospinosa]
MALTTDQKLLKQTKFPPEFDKKVDITKVNLDLIRNWIAGKLKAFDADDDIVTEMIFNYLEQDQFPNIKAIQITIHGFFPDNCPAFCKELWRLLLSAQDSPNGIAKEMVEAKKEELKKQEVSYRNVY